MNKVVSFFVITILFLALNLSVLAQKQARTQITKDFNTVSTEFDSIQAYLGWQRRLVQLADESRV